jgi:hypothetical protein
MFWKITSFVLLALSAIFVYSTYLNIPTEPIIFTLENEYKQATTVAYGQTPMFDNNLRFGKNDLTYIIDDTCQYNRRESMRKAFEIFEEEVKILTFKEDYTKTPDILVGCSDEYIKVSEHVFTAGEGGPSKILNNTKYRVITEGKISLFRDSRCEYPVVEIHELGHVLGFDHSPDPNNIMHDISNCKQRITTDMIQTIRELYTIEPLPDYTIPNVNVTQKGRYLDFNITISNEGLTNSEKGVVLGIYAEDEFIEQYRLGTIDIDFSRVLNVQNIRLPYQLVKEITFIVDYGNNIKEIDEQDNVARVINKKE